MPQIDTYPPGAPSWVDLMTPDQAAAEAFYSALFGWEMQRGSETVGGYSNCVKGGVPLAGIGQIPPDQPMPAAWTLYLSTPDAEASVAAATDAGGQVMAPVMSVSDGTTTFGTMAVLSDPSGAVFGVWQPGEHRGSGLQGEPGSLAWTEVVSADAKATRDMLEAMFDYDTEQIGDGSDFDYVQYSIGGRPLLGVWAATPEDLAAAPPHWNIYFQVDDVDDTAATASANGGQVIREPWDTPYGRIAILTDPQGAAFCVMKPPGQAEG